MNNSVKRDQAKLEPLLVTVTEAATILSLSRSTIYQMLDKQELPSIKHGTARRIPMFALKAWIEGQLYGQQEAA